MRAGESKVEEPSPGVGRPSRPEAGELATVEWISERLACGMANARIIYRMYAAQRQLSDIPTADFLLVEEYLSRGAEAADVQAEAIAGRRQTRQRFLHHARHYFFHSLVGRAANEALSRVLALRLGRLRGGNAVATADDYGFILTVTPAQVITEQDLPMLLTPSEFATDLDQSLSRSDLLNTTFATQPRRE